MSAATPPLFFVHVMKTAGATLRAHIRAQFDDEELYPSRAYDQDFHEATTKLGPLLALSPERLARVRAFMGHFPYVAVERLGRPVTVLTVLREPVERIVSTLKHIQVWSPRHKGLPIEAIYEDRYLHPMYLRNHQVRQFAFTTADAVESYMDWLDVDDGRLRIAQHTIERVDILGTVERYEAVLAELEQRYGWRLERRAHRNRNSRPVRLSATLRRRIEEDNAADLAFYDYARALVERRLSTGG